MRLLRKIAPLAISALMLGATVAAADLSTWKTDFANANIVVGSNAASEDAVAATNIATALGLTGVTVASGEATSSKTEDLTLDTSLFSALGSNSTLDDSDLSALQDIEITFEAENESYDLDVHEIINVTGTIETSAYGDEEYELTPVIEWTNGDLEYRYVFDDIPDSWNNVSDDYPLEISFLGRSLLITDVPDTDSVTIQVGTEELMREGSAITVEGHTLTVKAILDETVEVDVDGTSAYIDEGKSKKIGGLKVKLKKTYYDSNDPTRSAAKLIIGSETTKTYNDGDAYIVPCATPQTDGCSEDDPDWKWVIHMNTSSDSYLGVKFAGNWNENDEPVTRPGETIYFPENFASVKFDSLKVSDFATYTVQYKDSVDLTNSDQNISINDEPMIEMSSSVDEGIKVCGSYLTKKAYLWYNNSIIKIYYKDDDNKVQYGCNVSANGTSTFNIIYEDTTLTGYIYDEDTTTAGTQPEMKVGIDNGNLTINLNATGGDFVGIGNPEDAESSDVTFAYSGGTKNFGERDEDVLFYYGVKLLDPKDNAGNDKVILEVPKEEQEATVTVATYAAGTTTTTYTVKKDTEPESTFAGKPLIAVGGSAINSIAAKLLGLDYPTYGTDPAWVDATGVDSVGKGIIKIIDSPAVGTVAMVVAGYEAADTSALGTILKNSENYPNIFASGKKTALIDTTGMSLISVS